MGQEAATGHALRVLLADDEAPMRSLLARFLERQGWSVTVVEDGQAALEAWPVGGEPFDVVILDIQMPRLDGTRTYRDLRTRRPQASFLFVSGCPGATAWPEVKAWPVSCLLKPVVPRELVARVRELIKAAPNNGCA